MNSLETAIQKICSELDVSFTTISGKEFDQLEECLASRFRYAGLPALSIRTPNTIHSLGDKFSQFAAAMSTLDQCILIPFRSDMSVAFVLAGQDAFRIIDEIGFEYMLTDLERSFLFGENNHDIFMLAGRQANLEVLFDRK